MKVKVKEGLIKQLRTDKSWTQEKLAEMSGIHTRTIQRLESEGTVSVRTLNAIAKALDIEAYKLEFITDKIDFGPVLLELRILLLAITRHLLPTDARELPNSLVVVLALLSFLASYTLINTLLLVAAQPEQNFNSPATISLYVLIVLFSITYAGVVYPLFKLKNWARTLMLGICWVFFAINIILLSYHLASGAIAFSLMFDYLLNLSLVYWIYRILTRLEIHRLFKTNTAPEAQSSG